jgi:hypothetical protein
MFPNQSDDVSMQAAMRYSVKITEIRRQKTRIQRTTRKMRVPNASVVKMAGGIPSRTHSNGSVRLLQRKYKRLETRQREI